MAPVTCRNLEEPASLWHHLGGSWQEDLSCFCRLYRVRDYMKHHPPPSAPLNLGVSLILHSNHHAPDLEAASRTCAAPAQ